MTNEEAIKQLKWVQKRISEITYSPESFEAINLAIKALEQMDSCPVFSDDEVKQPCIEGPCGMHKKGKWICNPTYCYKCNQTNCNAVRWTDKLSIDADGNIRDFNGRVLFIHPTYNMDEYVDSEADND